MKIYLSFLFIFKSPELKKKKKQRIKTIERNRGLSIAVELRDNNNNKVVWQNYQPHLFKTSSYHIWLYASDTEPPFATVRGKPYLRPKKKDCSFNHVFMFFHSFLLLFFNLRNFGKKKLRKCDLRLEK